MGTHGYNTSVWIPHACITSECAIPERAATWSCKLAELGEDFLGFWGECRFNEWRRGDFSEEGSIELQGRSVMAQLQIILSERMKMILMRTVMTMVMMMSMEMAMMRLKRCGVACCVYWADPSPEYWSTTKDEARRPNFHKKQKGDDDHLNNKVIGTVSF